MRKDKIGGNLISETKIWSIITVLALSTLLVLVSQESVDCLIQATVIQTTLSL